MELTDKERRDAVALRAAGKSWQAAARAIGRSYGGLRRHLDEEFRLRANAASARSLKRRKLRPRINRMTENVRDAVPLYDPRSDCSLRPDNPLAGIFGDPPPGRRAMLDAFVRREFPSGRPITLAKKAIP